MAILYGKSLNKDPLLLAFVSYQGIDIIINSDENEFSL